MKFDSRLAGGSGYLELIWRTDVHREPGVNPQAIAYVTEIDGAFHGCYGIHTVVAHTVHAVKAELFALIEAGQ